MTSGLIDIDSLTKAVLRRVVERLDERDHQPAVLVDHAILACSLGVSRLTVYEHAQALGAVQLPISPLAWRRTLASARG